MPGPIDDLLSRDHARLEALLQRAIAEPGVVEMTAYGEFRAGLLRHIAMEEKVLFADARHRRNGVALPVVAQLHADHAALAGLLVPPPTHELISTIRTVLAEHDPLEEGPGGLYEACEQLAGTEVDEIVARLHAIPAVRASQHVDEPRVYASIARLLAARATTPRS